MSSPRCSPIPPTLGDRMHGRTCAGTWVTGTGADGAPREVYLYHVSDNAETMAKHGSQAVVWQTAINPVVALELLAAGAWQGAGVLGPEAFDAVPFLDRLRDRGEPWHIDERVPARLTPNLVGKRRNVGVAARRTQTWPTSRRARAPSRSTVRTRRARRGRCSSTGCGCCTTAPPRPGLDRRDRVRRAARHDRLPGLARRSQHGARSVADRRSRRYVRAQVGAGQVADHLEDVVGRLNRKPALIGHSFGGLLAQILAAGRGPPTARSPSTPRRSAPRAPAPDLGAAFRVTRDRQPRQPSAAPCRSPTSSSVTRPR